MDTTQSIGSGIRNLGSTTIVTGSPTAGTTIELHAPALTLTRT
ncbi:hypothetical protein [Dactylosporangium sp. NPDC050588]